MTTRTLQFTGMGFGPSPATIAASVGGNVVFSGAITTQNTPVSMDFNTYVPIFTAGIPVEFYGNVEVVVQVTNGTVAVGETRANYSQKQSTVYRPDDWAVINNPSSTVQQVTDVFASRANPPFSTEEYNFLLTYNPADPSTQTAYNDVLKAHNAYPFVSTGEAGFTAIFPDPEKNPAIDGVPIPVPDPQPDPTTGDWTFVCPAGSTLTFTLVMPQFGTSAGLV